MAAPLPDVQLATPAPPLLPSLVNARRLRSQRLGRALRLWVPAGVLILMLAMCFLLPLVVTLPSPTKGNIIYNNEPPFSPGHWLGTDVQGVDIFSQLVYGGQVAFEVGVSVTVIGLNLGGLVGAAAIIETIFQVQGIGNDLLTGISNHDEPLVEGITLVFALVTVLGNLLADLAYAVLDPRIRYGSSTS